MTLGLPSWPTPLQAPTLVASSRLGLQHWGRITWYQSSGRARSTYWGVLMAPKRTRKLVQKTMVEEPTQGLNVPFKVIREEEQKDCEE